MLFPRRIRIVSDRGSSKLLARPARVASGHGDRLDAVAIEPLIAALKDEHESVRWFAAEALGKLGDPRGVEPLEEMLDDKDADVREAARKALKKLCDQSEAKP